LVYDRANVSSIGAEDYERVAVREREGEQYVSGGCWGVRCVDWAGGCGTNGTGCGCFIFVGMDLLLVVVVEFSSKVRVIRSDGG